MADMQKIYMEYFQTVYGYLMTLTGGNEDTAEELTQETFYRATKNISQFREECKMSTWLCQIAKFTFYQYLDKKRRKREVPLDDAVETAMQEETEQNYINSEAKMLLYQKIQALDSPYRDVFMLRLTGDLCFKEIGLVMGRTENWARVTYYRAKQMLGKEIAHDE